jgi:serine/threonine protein phosphatase 1
MLKKITNFMRPAAAESLIYQTPEALRLYAIGDIHGRADLLEQMLNLIERDVAMNPTDATTKCIFLGDYVDRGPSSADVVERLIQVRGHSPHIICLMGNHEETMSLVLQGDVDPNIIDSWLGYGGRETLASYGVPSRILYSDDIDEIANAARSCVPKSHVEFFATLDLNVGFGDYFFVHAGIHPARPLSEQRAHDFMWIREPFLSHTAPLEKMIVHGHSISRAVEERSHRIGIDTGAYATGKLTAVVLEGNTRRFIETAYIV